MFRVLLFRVLLGLLAAVVPLTPGEAYAQRTYRCVDDKGSVHIEAGVLPAWCASQYAPVVSNKVATPQELEGIRRYLEGQLEIELAREARCRAQHDRIEEIKDNGLDSIDELSDNRRNGRVSRGETRAAQRIEQSAASAHVQVKQCAAQAQVRAGEVRTILSDPVKMGAALPEYRAEQQRLERERVAQQKAEQGRRLAAVEAMGEQERAKERAAEDAQQRARAQREAVEERGRAIRRDLGALLDRIAKTSQAVIDARETAYADLAKTEINDARLRGFQAFALQAPEYREPITAIVEGALALRAARVEMERETQLATSLAEMTARLQAMRNRLGSRGGSLLDRANRDDLARDVDAVRAEHEKAATVLTARRGSLVRVVERTALVSGSLQ